MLLIWITTALTFFTLAQDNHQSQHAHQHGINHSPEHSICFGVKFHTHLSIVTPASIFSCSSSPSGGILLSLFRQNTSSPECPDAHGAAEILRKQDVQNVCVTSIPLIRNIWPIVLDSAAHLQPLSATTITKSPTRIGSVMAAGWFSPSFSSSSATDKE